jgi:DNA-binding transcriptional regulator YiaG
MSPTQPKPMNGAQLAERIIKLGFNQSSFARCIGSADRTVRKWVSGTDPVPRHIALLVNLMIDYDIKPEGLRP